MEQWSLNYFSQLLNLLLTSTNITVGHIRLLLHLRQHMDKNESLHRQHFLSFTVNSSLIDIYCKAQIVHEAVLHPFDPSIHTCIIVTVGSILGGRGMWI